MIERVVSGGQTGADQAGWRAAKAAGLATGGWMPKGFLTEDGPRPEFADEYGARAHASASYRDRTAANVVVADWTIYFGNPYSRGGRATYRAFAEKVGDNAPGSPPIYRNGWLSVFRDGPHAMAPQNVAHALRNGRCRVLNVAGNRESSAPGIGEWVEAFLADVFRLVKEGVSC